VTGRAGSPHNATAPTSRSLPGQDHSLNPPIPRRAPSRHTPRIAAEGEPSVFRVGAVSYLGIATADPHRAARFYEAVFDWNVRLDRDEPGFADGSGHVIGHFVAHDDQPVTGEGGVRPYA
jgi:hypothetical protein